MNAKDESIAQEIELAHKLLGITRFFGEQVLRKIGHLDNHRRSLQLRLIVCELMNSVFQDNISMEMVTLHNVVAITIDKKLIEEKQDEIITKFSRHIKEDLEKLRAQRKNHDSNCPHCKQHTSKDS